jgi:hypothetical protein
VENGGKLLPYGRMSKVIQGLADHNVHVSRDVLNCLVKRIPKSPTASTREDRHPLSIIDVNLESESNVSSLHAVEGAENLVVMMTTKKTGRPKGTTKMKLYNDVQQRKVCMAEIAKDYDRKMNEVKATGGIQTRVTKGYMKDLIEEKKKEYGIAKSFYISVETIKTRLKKRQLDPPHPGILSPIASAEETLVQMLIAMGNMRQPLTPTKGLH